jgi:ribosome maturation factor RimP
MAAAAVAEEYVYGSQRVAERIREIASPILWALGLELVDVVCSGQGPRTVVRIFIDKPGGVTLRDCEQAHLSLGPAMDVADPIPHAYTLEVSSPGLDRPLKRVEDYRRAIGKSLNLKLKAPYEGRWRIAGRLVEVEDHVVVVELLEDSTVRKTVRLQLEGIAEAKPEVKF